MPPRDTRDGGRTGRRRDLAVLATGGVAVASDAVAGGAVTAGPIRACFQPGTMTAPLQVLTRGHTTCPAVPVSGIYYITASATILVASGDLVAGAVVPGPIEPQTTQFGAPSETISASLAVNGALSMSAGQAPSLICIDANSNANTQFLQGSLNATLISSSNAAARTRPHRAPAGVPSAPAGRARSWDCCR